MNRVDCETGGGGSKTERLSKVTQEAILGISGSAILSLSCPKHFARPPDKVALRGPPPIFRPFYCLESEKLNFQISEFIIIIIIIIFFFKQKFPLFLVI